MVNNNNYINITTTDTTSTTISPLSILYTGSCNIYSYSSVTNTTTKVTSQVLSLVFENIPCRASQYTPSTIQKTEFFYSKNNSIKLFLQADLIISSGSIFIVTQNNRTIKYKSSAEASVFSNHQEIILNLFDDISWF